MSSRAAIDLNNANAVKRIAGITLGFINGAAWSPDGSILAVAHGERVSLWVNGFGGPPTRQLEHGAPVKALAFTPDGSALATASSDMLVRLWSTVETFILITLRGHTGSVEAIAFSANGRLIGSGAGDGGIRIVDMTDSIGTSSLSGHTASVNGLAFNSTGRLLASCGSDQKVRLWDLQARAEVAEIPFGGIVRALAATPDRLTFAASARDGEIRLVDFATLETVATFFGHTDGADALAFSPDGALLASGGRDGAVKLWNWRTGALLATLAAHQQPVLALAFNPVGTLLLSGGGDNALHLWSVEGVVGNSTTSA